jgi:hypothetical protein
MAKQKAAQVLVNKQFREMADSQPIMISTAYDETRETFRFVWRNERFVLAHGRSPVLGSCSDSGMAPQAIENTKNGLGKWQAVSPRPFGRRIDDANSVTPIPGQNVFGQLRTRLGGRVYEAKPGTQKVAQKRR